MWVRICNKIYLYLIKQHKIYKERQYRKKYDIAENANLNHIEDTFLVGQNISIGDYSYINSGRLICGKKSRISIGKWVAIGYGVSIYSASHDTNNATGPVEDRPGPQADVVIHDNVWIGNNVFIKHGVTIGNNSVVGANSVVVSDIPPYTVYGGVPAIFLKKVESNHK